MPPNAARKLLFLFPAMVRDLLAGFFPREWVEELDLSTPRYRHSGAGLERWPGEHRQRRPSPASSGPHVAGTMSRPVALRSGVARVPVRSRPHHACPECLCRGAARILAYTALLYQDLLRTSSDPLPPVLPVVLHHGRERWTAAEDVAGLTASPGEFLAPYQPAQRYLRHAAYSPAGAPGHSGWSSFRCSG